MKRRASSINHQPLKAMNELKRKLALWLCPELEEELKACNDTNEWLRRNLMKKYEEMAEEHDNSQKAMIALHKRLSDTELALTKAQDDKRQLIAELSIKKKELKKAYRHKTIKPRKV